MNTVWDDDEYEPVYTSHDYGNGMGSFGLSWRRRDPAEVAKIRAERQRKHEDAVLAEADAIRARRGIAPS